MSETKRRVLVVDDDQSILRVLKRILERKGYLVTTVSNGKDALTQIGQGTFDASIVDVRLPDMLGTEVVRKINGASPRTVRIIFTGSPGSYENKNKNKDVDAFLLKPVKPEELLAILHEKITNRPK